LNCILEVNPGNLFALSLS
jgi:hypothetical protein